MKALLLILLSGSVMAGDNFIARTLSCSDKVIIVGSEGESFVYALHQGKRRKLIEQNKKILTKFRKETLTYQSDTAHESYQLGDATFTFVLPASVMSQPPGITVFLSGISYQCQMTYKD